jgi:hypothetical protein
MSHLSAGRAAPPEVWTAGAGVAAAAASSHAATAIVRSGTRKTGYTYVYMYLCVYNVYMCFVCMYLLMYLGTHKNVFLCSYTAE